MSDYVGHTYHLDNIVILKNQEEAEQSSMIFSDKGSETPNFMHLVVGNQKEKKIKAKARRLLQNYAKRKQNAVKSEDNIELIMTNDSNASKSQNRKKSKINKKKGKTSQLDIEDIDKIKIKMKPKTSLKSDFSIPMPLLEIKKRNSIKSPKQTG